MKKMNNVNNTGLIDLPPKRKRGKLKINNQMIECFKRHYFIGFGADGYELYVLKQSGDAERMRGVVAILNEDTQNKFFRKYPQGPRSEIDPKFIRFVIQNADNDVKPGQRKFITMLKKQCKKEIRIRS